MHASQSSAPRRGPEPDTATLDEEAVAGHRWPVRFRRALLATAVGRLEAAIAALQRLRTMAGGAHEADDRRSGERGRPAAGRREAAPAPAQAEAPKPRRRLRRLLIHLAVMLAGSTGGMALAYDLFAQLLKHQTTQIDRQREEISRQSKTLAGHLKKLEAERAKRIEAENRLALIAQDLAQRPPTQEAPAPAGKAAAGPAKTGNCTLGAANIGSALKGCIDQFNRP